MSPAEIEIGARLLLENYERQERERLGRVAIAAASQAADAVAELLVFAREGPLGAHQNFNNEPVEKLADALKMTIGIELDAHDENVGTQGDREYVGALNRLMGVVSNFLEDWAG